MTDEDSLSHSRVEDHAVPIERLLMHEDVIKVTDICELMPSKPTRETVYNWIRNGIRGHRLEAVKVGGKCWLTSKQAIVRFVKAINLNWGDE